MRILVLAAALAVLASPVLAAEPGYVGGWAVSGTGCPKSLGENDGYIQIKRKQVLEHEGGCDIVKNAAEPTGWTVNLACGSEGEFFKRKVHWSIDEKGKLVQFEKGKKTVYDSCPVIARR